MLLPSLLVDEKKLLYVELGLNAHEVEAAEVTTDSKHPDIKALSVFRYWRTKNGAAATKAKILEALENCNLIDAKEKIESAWNMSS